MNDAEFQAAWAAAQATSAAPVPAPAGPGVSAVTQPRADVPAPRARPPRRVDPGVATGAATRHPGTHPCPGCAAPVFDHLLACRGCWARLPRPAREAVVRGATRDHLVAANAVADAFRWWRGHAR